MRQELNDDLHCLDKVNLRVVFLVSKPLWTQQAYFYYYRQKSLLHPRAFAPSSALCFQLRPRFPPLPTGCRVWITRWPRPLRPPPRRRRRQQPRQAPPRSPPITASSSSSHNSTMLPSGPTPRPRAYIPTQPTPIRYRQDSKSKKKKNDLF